MARKDAKVAHAANPEERVGIVARAIKDLLETNGCVIRNRVIIEGATVRSEVVVDLAAPAKAESQPAAIG